MRQQRARAMLVLALFAGTACSSHGRGPNPGALALSNDDRLVAEQQLDGRLWRIYNDCPMARNTTWVSDDKGKSWMRHPGPGFINCTVASSLRLHVRSREEAEAEVDHGPDPTHERWVTTNAGTNWRMTSTDLGG